MSIRKLIVVASAAGVLTLGVSGVALAQEKAGHRKVDCSKLSELNGRIDARVAQVQERIAKGEAALQKAKDAGNTDLAQKIQGRLDKVHQRLDRVPQLKQKLADHCASATPSTP